jgi:hypothetical protein
MPALLKGDLGPFVWNAILDVYLTVNFGVVWTSILDSFLSTFWPRWRETICRYMGVFWVGGVGPDVFLTSFGTGFYPCFWALWNPNMLPAVQKIVGRYFAHREQECPSRTTSVSRKVKKTQKTGFQ